MKTLLDKINQLFGQVPDTTRKYRWLVWGGFILLTVFIARGMGRIQVDMSMESFFQETEPVKQAYDRFRAVFGSDEMVYVVYEAKDGDVFSEQSLSVVREIQEELLNYRLSLKPEETSPLDHITEVKTLINVKYLETREDTLISRDFIGENIPQNIEERERLRKQAMEQPDYPLLYFSENSGYGGMLIKTDFNAVVVGMEEEDASVPGTSLDTEESIISDEEIVIEGSPDQMSEHVVPAQDALPTFQKTGMDEYALFEKAINDILYQEKYTNALTFYPAGNPIQMAFAYKAMGQEIGKIMGALLLLILVSLWISFRSLSGVLWPLLLVILTLIWIFGIIGWSGVVMNAMIEIIVFLVLAVGVADAVHIVSGYIFFRRQNQAHKDALRSVFNKSGLACFLTSLTTAIGLVALLFVPIVTIQKFGLFAALGVSIAFVLTIILLPLMLDLWSPVSKKRAQRMAASTKPPVLQTLLQKMESFSYTYPKVIVSLFFIAGIILLVGAFKIEVDTNSIEAIKESAPIRKAYELVNQMMGGTGSFQILIDTAQVDGMKKPEVLNAIEALQNTLETRHPEYVVKTVSLVNVTKDSFKALNEGRQEMYVIPQDPHVLAQTLFLFNNANPKDRRQLVSDDYRMGRISVNTRNFGSQVGLKLMAEVDGYIANVFAPLKQTYPELNVTVTGQIPLSNKLASYISWSQIKSFGITLLVISLLLLVVLGSKKVGLIAIIPNIFPILTIFGLMGYLKIPLEIHLLLVAPITIGIAVDDTIHFLTHYRLEMQNHNDIRKAIQNTIREAGQAIVFTSVILSVGFLSYLLSVGKGFIYFGIFSGIAMFTALLADLFLLPAMLVIFECRFKNVL